MVGERFSETLITRGEIETVNERPYWTRYRKPRHPEFEPRTAWSWFNSVTEMLKGVSMLALPTRTQALRRLLDYQVGLLDNLAANVGEN